MKTITRMKSGSHTAYVPGDPRDLHRKTVERKIRRLSFAVAFISAALLTVWAVRERNLIVQAKSERATRALAEEVLRFHVLADSNSGVDQTIKMRVKEKVLSYLREELPDGSRTGDGEPSLAQTRQFVREHLIQIRKTAEDALRAEGCDDAVSAELVTDTFPKKRYGDVVFPAGEYEALRICIGSARGRNWWCCLYPNLCFTDAVHARVPDEEKEALAGVLDADSYEMITCMTDVKIKWFFFPDH